MDEGNLHMRLNQLCCQPARIFNFQVTLPANFQLLSYFLGLFVDFEPKVVPDTYLHLFIQHIKKFFTLLGVCVLVTLMA